MFHRTPRLTSQANPSQSSLLSTHSFPRAESTGVAGSTLTPAQTEIAQKQDEMYIPDNLVFATGGRYEESGRVKQPTLYFENSQGHQGRLRQEHPVDGR